MTESRNPSLQVTQAVNTAMNSDPLGIQAGTGEGASVVRCSHAAMVTVLEIFAVHPDENYARQAAWAAFGEADRLEQELSRFIPNSDISRINRLDTDQSLRVGVAALECLEIAAYLFAETGGAFDVTLGTGMRLLELHPEASTICLRGGGVQVDLGGIGKGYVVDRMAMVLRDWEIGSALIHAGQSSVLALAPPPGAEGWALTMSMPGNRATVLNRVIARQMALSGSGLEKGTHIIDPHSARAVSDKLAAWVLVPAPKMGSLLAEDGALEDSSAPQDVCVLHPAAVADALSTAFMVMSPEQVRGYCESHSEVQALIVAADGYEWRFGGW